jgi:hypothetical protein
MKNKTPLSPQRTRPDVETESSPTSCDLWPWYFCVTAIVGGVCSVWIALWILGVAPHPPSAAPEKWDLASPYAWPAAGFMALMCVLSCWFTRVRLTINARGIRRRGLVRQMHVRWEDVRWIWLTDRAAQFRTVGGTFTLEFVLGKRRTILAIEEHARERQIEVEYR